METMKNTVMIRLPRERGENGEDAHLVTINEKQYLVKRGVDVEVPIEVAHAIEDEEEMREAAYLYNEKVTKIKH